jgi:hypothetical protein
LNIGGWDDNGGMTNANLYFTGVQSTSNLSCVNTEDQFSVFNSNAKLTYKVGLISIREMLLFNSSNIFKTGQNYWLNTPYSFESSSISDRYVYSTGYLYNNSIVSNLYGVRPTVSLIPGIKYTEGDGSKEHPYVIKTN